MRFLRFTVTLLAGIMLAGVIAAPMAVAADCCDDGAKTHMVADANAHMQNAAADYDSWGAMADAIRTELAEGRAAYIAGDHAAAASHFSKVLNTGYVASNFAKATADVLGPDVYAAQLRQLQSLSSLAYREDGATQIKQSVQQISAQLVETARRLDSTDSLANPRNFAQARAKQMRAERERLDANKVRTNKGRGERSWTEVAQQMQAILDDAVKTADSGDGDGGAAKVNDAYYQYYEKLGFEKNVMNAIGGSRVSKVESTFKEARKAMVAGRPSADLIADLKATLAEDAATLDGDDGASKSVMTSFVTSAGGQSFLVLIREGLEALLVVAAVVAYLLRSGMRRFVRWVYAGALLGLAGSFLVAMVLTRLFGGSGPQQEIMEGICALIATVMLIWSGNWMFSKRSVESWNSYIRTKTESAVASVGAGQSAAGKAALSLAMLSFLAVFREGAETVIFYESIYSMTQDGRGMWLGGLCAAAVLAVLFMAIRFTSVRIPIGPFFMVTSVLMSALAVVFAGGGVHSLIEGDLIAGTYLEGLPTNDWLGLYPYLQTIVAQIVAAIIVVGMFVVGGLRHRAKTPVEQVGAVETTAE